MESLWLNGYRNVTAGIRQWSSAARIARFPVRFRLCDITDRHQVENSVKNVDIVIHCAYGSRDTTVLGTETLLDSSLRNNVKKVLHFSTIDVYGDVEGEIEETCPLKPRGVSYADSKIEAEEICQTYIQRGLPIVVFRPTVVYGPYSELWISKFADRLRSGNWRIFGEDGEGACNLLYIQDLIDAVYLALSSDMAAGQAFNINGPDFITWNDYFRRFNHLLGLPELQEIRHSRATLKTALFAPTRSLARFLLKHAGEGVKKLYQSSALMGSLMKRTEHLLRTTPSGVELKQFHRKARYSISKAQALLNFNPRFRIDQGLALCTLWLTHEFHSSAR